MRVEINTLLRTHRAFLKQPDKIFLLKDFTIKNKSRFRERYIHVLLKLGIIEEVDKFIQNGILRKTTTKGYKLK